VTLDVRWLRNLFVRSSRYGTGRSSYQIADSLTKSSMFCRVSTQSLGSLAGGFQGWAWEATKLAVLREKRADSRTGRRVGWELPQNKGGHLDKVPYGSSSRGSHVHAQACACGYGR